MSLELLTLSGSPFGWKVQLALAHLGLAYTPRFLSNERGDLRQPEFLMLNPHGKAPVLIDREINRETVLFESDVIVEYLQDAYAAGKASLWPRTPVARAMARRVASEASGYLYPPLRWLVMQWSAQLDRGFDRVMLDEHKRTIATQLDAFAPGYPTVSSRATVPAPPTTRSIRSSRCSGGPTPEDPGNRCPRRFPKRFGTGRVASRRSSTTRPRTHRTGRHES